MKYIMKLMPKANQLLHKISKVLRKVMVVCNPPNLTGRNVRIKAEEKEVGLSQ